MVTSLLQSRSFVTMHMKNTINKSKTLFNGTRRNIYIHSQWVLLKLTVVHLRVGSHTYNDTSVRVTDSKIYDSTFPCRMTSILIPVLFNT